MGGAAGAGADRSRRAGAARDAAPAVPRPRRFAGCSKSCRRRRRSVAHGAIGAGGDRRRCSIRTRRVRRGAARRGRTVPRRHLVLPHVVGSWPGREQARRGRRRPLPAPPPLSDGQVFARLELRVTDVGRACPARRRRSRRTARHRPLGRRHARHAREPVAVGSRPAQARVAIRSSAQRACSATSSSSPAAARSSAGAWSASRRSRAQPPRSAAASAVRSAARTAGRTPRRARGRRLRARRRGRRGRSPTGCSPRRFSTPRFHGHTSWQMSQPYTCAPSSAR